MWIWEQPQQTLQLSLLPLLAQAPQESGKLKSPKLNAAIQASKK